MISAGITISSKYIFLYNFFTGNEVTDLFKTFLERAKKFTIVDYGLIKTIFFLLGIIIGTFASEFFSGIILLVIILFVVLYTIFIVRFFKK